MPSTTDPGGRVFPPTCTVLVHGDLLDFWPADRRDGAVERPVAGRPAVLDVIEATGVPHCEIDVVVVDGEVTHLGHRVGAGSRVDAHPRGGRPDMPNEARLLPPARRPERFLLDGHLGRLARHLRLLGLDTAYERDADDATLAERSAAEDRTLLTRDVGLLRRGVVRRGAWVRSTDPRCQVVEVLRRYPPGPGPEPLRRCLVCNGQLVDVAADDVTDLVPPRSRTAFDSYRRCDRCGRVYWPGSHHDRLVALVSEIRSELAGPTGSE